MPHSDTHGSKPARGSPWLFAACHVFHRLLVPRHPPNALIALIHHTCTGAIHPGADSPAHKKVQFISRPLYSLYVVHVRLRHIAQHAIPRFPGPSHGSDQPATRHAHRRTNLFTLTKNKLTRHQKPAPHRDCRTDVRSLFPKQQSYTPGSSPDPIASGIRQPVCITHSKGHLVEADGIEPTTPCLQSRCSPS